MLKLTTQRTLYSEEERELNMCVGAVFGSNGCEQLITSYGGRNSFYAVAVRYTLIQWRTHIRTDVFGHRIIPVQMSGLCVCVFCCRLYRLCAIHYERIKTNRMNSTNTDTLKRTLIQAQTSSPQISSDKQQRKIWVNESTMSTVFSHSCVRRPARLRSCWNISTEWKIPQTLKTTNMTGAARWRRTWGVWRFSLLGEWFRPRLYDAMTHSGGDSELRIKKWR